jgi:hypothetical protein
MVVTHLRERGQSERRNGKVRTEIFCLTLQKKRGINLASSLLAQSMGQSWNKNL